MIISDCCAVLWRGLAPCWCPPATGTRGKGNTAAVVFPGSGSPVVLSEAGRWWTRRVEITRREVTRWQWQVVGVKAVYPMASLLCVWTQTKCLWTFKKISNANCSLKPKPMPCRTHSPRTLCLSTFSSPRERKTTSVPLIPILSTFPRSFPK